MFVRVRPESETLLPEPPREAARETGALSPQRRGRIIAGAAAIFERDGYEGASMAQIADAARVSKGTLYNYFPSKPALFEAFVRERCAKLVETLFGEADSPRLAEAPADVTTELARIGRDMLRMMMSADGRAMYRVVVMEATKFPELALAFYNAGPRTVTDRMAAWLARQIDGGALRPHDTKFAAEQFFALTQARLLMQARTDATFVPTDEEIEFVVEGAVSVFLAAYGHTSSG